MKSQWRMIGLAFALLAGPLLARAQEERADKREGLEQEQQTQADERRQHEAERAQREEERSARASERAEDERQRADEMYDRGTEALDEGRWDRALSAFDDVCRLNGQRCDGALYWKAYAQGRLGRRTEAQATLAELKKSHPQSRWLSEARALELELGQASGKPVGPESADDEELKLLALNSLMSSDSERALLLLETFLKSNRSPRLRDRALFVLSQSDSPHAHEILLGIARGTQSPDLQARAVKYLGMSGDASSCKELGEIYATADVPLRRQILQAFLVADDKARILDAARTEKAPELRREAFHLLGAMGAVSELQQLYKAETTPELRREILDSFVAADASDALIAAARTEREPSLRLEAVRRLGALDAEQTGPALVALYGAESNSEVRSAVLDAFTAQDNCPALVQIAKTEKDAGLRRALVERLGGIECQEATDFLLDLLKK